MKLREINMFRRSSTYAWVVEPIDPRSYPDVLFICSDELNKRFPRLQHRRKAVLTVHNKAVKGSKMFHIVRPYRVMNFTHGIKGVDDLYCEMKHRINDLLDSQKKERMQVWVTCH